MNLQDCVQCLLLIMVVALGSNCSDHQSEAERIRAERIAKRRALSKLNVHHALPAAVKHPADNPTSAQKVELGRLLFFDPILSGDRDVACATCHHPSQGYAEFRDLSIGVNGTGLGLTRRFNEPNTIPLVKRNAHTILNTAFNGIDIRSKYDPETAPMFWDSRVQSLELQAIEPLKALEEMKGEGFSEEGILVEIERRLTAIPAYVDLFAQVFDDHPAVTIENVGKAIAAFERSLITNNSRFDQYMRGDEDAISLSEQDGFKLFVEVGCGHCHNGAMFTDYQKHVIGVPHNPKLSTWDKGIEESYAFRTPTLRNLRFTAPYMHNGKFSTLLEVLEFYEDISFGKHIHEDLSKDDLDPLVNELNLRVKDMRPIISFLNCLNDTSFDKSIPSEVPSGLPVGGEIE